MSEVTFEIEQAIEERRSRRNWRTPETALVMELRELLPGLQIRGWNNGQAVVSIEGACLQEHETMLLIFFLRRILQDRPNDAPGASAYHNHDGWQHVLRYACQRAGLPQLY